MLYLISIIPLVNKIINHNCTFSNVDLNNYNLSESIDYQISCRSNAIQHIDVDNLYNVNSVSIFDNSNVIITCKSDLNNEEYILLKIYDTPNITFENYCNFKQVEPYDNIFICNDNFFKVSLYDNYMIVRCSNIYDYTLLYSSLSNLTFEIDNIATYLMNDYKDKEDLVAQRIDDILSSFNFIGRKKLIFNDIDLDSITKYTNEDIKGTWIKLNNISNYGCLWIDEPGFSEKYENYFERGWKKICIDDKTYIYCCDTDLGPRKLNIISKSGSLAIIIFIICFIFVLIVSLCSIAYCRYKTKDQVDNSHHD